MAMTGVYEVYMFFDGTIGVVRRHRPLDADELDAWAADMEQRLAQYRTARRRVDR